MSNDWTTLHTVDHKSSARGVDISVRYYLQAQPVEDGSIRIRIHVQQEEDLPVIPLPRLADQEEYRPVLGKPGVLSYKFSAQDILCLPCEPVAYRHCLSNACLTDMRGSIGWDGKTQSYSFAEYDGGLTMIRNPHYSDGSGKIAARWKCVERAAEDVSQSVATNLEFIQKSIAWREACLKEFNEWCAKYEDIERQQDSNKASAQSTIDGLASLISKLTNA